MNNNPSKTCAQCNLAQHDPRLRVVIKLISTKFREPICVCELGRLAGLEPFELTNLFKREIGITPKRLLTALRIAFAINLLLHTDHQIKGIAAESGLPVVDTFIRNFGEICGVTPGEFRRLMEEHQAVNPPPSISPSTSISAASW